MRFFHPDRFGLARWLLSGAVIATIMTLVLQPGWHGLVIIATFAVPGLALELKDHK